MLYLMSCVFADAKTDKTNYHGAYFAIGGGAKRVKQSLGSVFASKDNKVVLMESACEANLLVHHDAIINNAGVYYSGLLNPGSAPEAANRHYIGSQIIPHSNNNAAPLNGVRHVELKLLMSDIWKCCDFTSIGDDKFVAYGDGHVYAAESKAAAAAGGGAVAAAAFK